jgi:hypothetical protein
LEKPKCVYIDEEVTPIDYQYGEEIQLYERYRYLDAHVDESGKWVLK